jgi:GTP-binding protein EngB required for normal cell division
MRFNITTLVLREKLAVGDEVRCVSDGEVYGLSKVVPGRKPDTYGLQYRVGDVSITAYNPTSFVKAMLPKGHYKLTKSLNGWLYAQCGLRDQTLQKLKDDIKKADAADIEHAEVPNYIDIEDEAENVLIEKLPALTDEQRSDYDSAVEALRNGDVCAVQMRRMGLHERYPHSSVINCVAAGALGMNALKDESKMKIVRAIAAAAHTDADDKERMELGFLAATEKEIPALAAGLQVDITVLHQKMKVGHQFELQGGVPAVTEAMRKACTTHRAFAATDTDSIPAAHIVLQTVERVSDDKTNVLVVDLVRLCTSCNDADHDTDNMTDDVEADTDEENDMSDADVAAAIDGSVQQYRNRLLALLQLVKRDALNRQLTVNTATNKAAAVDAQASIDKINDLTSTAKQKLKWVKAVKIFFIGYSKAGKSIAMSALIQEGVQTADEYYKRHYRGTHNVYEYDVVDTTGDLDDAARAQKIVAMRALDVEMDARVKHEYNRYDLNRILSSQSAGATTAAPLVCESCGDDAPSLTLTLKPKHVVYGVLNSSKDFLQECETAVRNGEPKRVTMHEQIARLNTLEHARNLLGKDYLPADVTRAELGLRTATTATNEYAGDASDDNDADDDFEKLTSMSDASNGDDSGDDSDVEESKGDDTNDTTTSTAASGTGGADTDAAATTVFEIDSDYNTVADYSLPASTEPYISMLLGLTVKVVIHAHNKQELVHEFAKLLIRWTAPTYSAYALWGLIESVVLRVPSSNLDQITMIDLPGFDKRDTARAEYYTDALDDGLNSGETTMLVHFVHDSPESEEVYRALTDANVFIRLLHDPNAVRIVLAFPSDKYSNDNRRLHKKEIESVKHLHVKQHYEKLLQKTKQELKDAGSKSKLNVKAALKSIKFVSIETHPLKVSAQLTNNTTAAQPELAQLKRAISAYSTASWERALVSVVDSIGNEVAIQAYRCYQAEAIFQPQLQQQHISSGSVSSIATSPWQDVQSEIELTAQELSSRGQVMSHTFLTDTTPLIARTVNFSIHR